MVARAVGGTMRRPLGSFQSTAATTALQGELKCARGKEHVNEAGRRSLFALSLLWILQGGLKCAPGKEHVGEAGRRSLFVLSLLWIRRRWR